MKVVNIVGEKVTFENSKKQKKTKVLSDIIESGEIFNFKEKDTKEILERVKCSDGFYEKDRTGNIVLVSNFRLPFLFILIAFFSAFMVMSCLGAMRQVVIYDYKIFAGIFFFPLAFTCSDLINELFGYRLARISVYCVSITLVLTGFIHYLSLKIPGLYAGGDDSLYLSIFNNYPLSFILHGLSLLVAYTANCKIFSWIRFNSENKYLWLRCLVSTFVSQIMYGVVLTPVAALLGFHEDKTVSDLVNLVFSSHILKMCIALATIPVIYVVVFWVKKIEHKQYVSNRLRDVNFLQNSSQMNN